jgi:hypothetical protein
MLTEARYFARMMAGCQRFLRTPPLANPRAAIEHNLRHREDHFLELMRNVVFAKPENPYHRLFVKAGCRVADLEGAVRRHGLDATLEQLRAAGVYLRHDEFKGKTPIVRDGEELGLASPRQFANPLVRGALETTSSGSRSRGTVTRPSAEFQAYREAQDALFVGQFEPETRAIVAVLPILPSTVGFHRMLTFQRRGTPVEKWFALGGTLGDSAHYRLLIRLLVLQARANGVWIPFPTYIHEGDFAPVVEWMAKQRELGRPLLWMGPVSMGVLVAATARERGISLQETVFLCGAEPLTEARRLVMEQAGGSVYPRYGISELGWVGCSCRAMRSGSTVHLMRDAMAAITWRRPAPMTDIVVNSLLFTTLLPVSTYVLVNVEMEDCGTLEEATCGCEFAAMGFTQQIRDVYSFGKLTGQGITLLGGDLIRVLEVSLPERFGGTPADYQLVELDGADGAIVELRIHPRLKASSLPAVRDFFLSEVRRLWGGSLTARQWGQTGAVRVVSKEPMISGGRKINPLHLLGSGRSAARSETTAAASGGRDQE